MACGNRTSSCEALIFQSLILEKCKGEPKKIEPIRFLIPRALNVSWNLDIYVEPLLWIYRYNDSKITYHFLVITETSNCSCVEERGGNIVIVF